MYCIEKQAGGGGVAKPQPLEQHGERREKECGEEEGDGEGSGNSAITAAPPLVGVDPQHCE